MKKQGHDAGRYEELTVPIGEAGLEQDEVWRYRTRVTDAGPMKYVEVFPVFRSSRTLRAAKQKLTKEAQQRGNRRRAMLRVEQLIHENFDERDAFVTLTFRDEDAPVGDDEVRKAVRSWIGKLRRIARKRGEELRYLYVMELPDRPEGDMRKYREAAGWHVHAVIGGVSREEAEDAWEKGMANSRRLQDSKERFAGLARYMLKRRDSARMWAKSRNLREPKVRTCDRRPGKVKVAKLCEDVRAFAAEIFEGLYPGYSLTEDPEVRTGELFQGAIIRARMRRWKDDG